jgi:uncharacterized membrane protein YoaK (UPF0700 family)
LSVWRDLVDTVHPPRDGRDGPLPPLMLMLTVVTGLVDATSYLHLGRVFVANMTGNVVFLGFALAGAKELSVGASIAALAAFLVGGLIGGTLTARLGGHRGLLLRAALIVQLAFVAGAAAIALATGADASVGSGTRYCLIVLLAIGMGIQNATVRRLGVRDLMTTVLTMTLTGIAADAPVVGGRGAAVARRTLSIGAMLLGAVVGALLVLHVDDAAPLGAAALLIALTAFAAHRLSRTPGAWTKP